MHLPEIDKYSDLNSLFHTWDPRVKLISFSILILSIVLLPDIISAFMGFILAIILVFISKIPFSFVLKSLKWVIIFILFFLIIMPLTVPGNVIVDLKIATISHEGSRLGLLIALRAISVCMIIFPMIGTMKFHNTLKALEELKVPNKLIQIIMFTYRYIYVSMEETERIFTAAKARLFKKKTNMHTIKTTGNLIGILFVRGFERTERVYNAMSSRGYKGNIKTLNEFQLSRGDLFKGLLIVSPAIMLNFTRFML